VQLQYIYSNTAINDGNWHHIAVIWDYSSDESGESFVYVDGVNDSSSSSNYLARNENNSSDTFKKGKKRDVYKKRDVEKKGRL